LSALVVRDLVVDAPDAKGQPILGPVSFEIAEGEHVLVVGPSGSGKTTLLRAIAGLSKPRAGSIEIFGARASEGSRSLLPPAQRQVGLLFQGGALWPHMTVRKTLEFVFTHSGLPRGEWDARYAEMTRLVDLEGFDDRKPATLSGGEGQRLALARALASRPRLLLLDEPLGPLDADRRRSLLERLDVLQQELQLTILHVTHDPAEASGVSARSLVLESGRLATSKA